VIFTAVKIAPGGADAGWFAVKVPGLSVFEEGSPYAAFPEAPAPAPGEIVVTKQYASSFFGTSLAATLNAQRVDTVIVLGFSTSGCVRATALDALQAGFAVTLDDTASRGIDPEGSARALDEVRAAGAAIGSAET
jgi:maleamate amidohydrolase